MKKLKILLIDSEGGHGGSSKSLFFSIKNIVNKKIHLSVVCKKNSWIKKEYKKNNIDCNIFEQLPTFTVLDTLIKNFYYSIIIYPVKIIKFLYYKSILLKYINNFDIIHLNHSNLWLIAKWLKRRKPNLKITVHIRTMPYSNFFAKIQYKSLLKNTDKQIFITENEYYHFCKLTSSETEKNIIFNPVEKVSTNDKKYSYLKKKRYFLIGSFSNYSYYRGTDRIFEVASAIPSNILNKIKFIIAGDINIPRGAKKKLKHLQPFDNLKQYAESLGLKKHFHFLGHVNDVENILIHLNLTIKLTREYNPWGRDILESMFYKTPVISIGKYDTFIKNNYSGVLFKEYEPFKIANEIIYLFKNPDVLYKLSKNTKEIIKKNCNPKKRSSLLVKFWKAL